MFMHPSTSLGLLLLLRKSILVLFSTTLLFVPTLILASPTTIVVNDYSDVKKSNDGRCTLREAIIAANQDRASGGKPGECNAGDGADTIILPAGTYQLTRTDSGREDSSNTGDLDVLESLTIVGAGADVTIIDGGLLTDRLLHTIIGEVHIEGVSFINGSVPGEGGGVYNETSLTLTNVAIDANQASGSSGGFVNAMGATAVLDRVTISNNSGNGASLAGSVQLINSTISGSGGGVKSSGTVSFNSVTIFDNGGALEVTGGILTIENSIIGGACSGTLTSAGYNLVESNSCAITGDTTGNLIGIASQLEPLANNGGQTASHAPLATSPAVEAGTDINCPPTDQRGVTRPIGARCDIGAFEFENPPQSGPTIFVNTTEDSDDGVCDFEHCTLREAIHAANDSATITTITFAIAETDPTIAPGSPLPTITEPVTIDGTNQSGGVVTLDGSGAGAASGLTITAGSSTVRGLRILNFQLNGVSISGSGGNVIENSEIATNGANGIEVMGATHNRIQGNNIHDNGELSIDLGGDGRSRNDRYDLDSGANDVQNFPSLIAAVPGSSLTAIGYLHSQPNQTFTLEFFAGSGCPQFGGGMQTVVGTKSVTTDSNGSAYFIASGLDGTAEGQYITATATDANGNSSELSDCIVVSVNNTSWPNALPLSVAGDFSPTSVEQQIDQPGQSRWYRFTVQPNSQIRITLTDLPANYDLTVYRDINAVYQTLLTPQSDDLALLGAEFAPEAFSPEAFSPEAFSPEAFSPEAFSPEAFSPEAFSPEAFSPEAFSPEAFSPEAFSPEAFSPEAFSPEAFSPEAFSPEAFSPEAFSPEAFSPEAFSSAQLRSLLGVSAFNGQSSEGLILNSWNNTGEFYIRVRSADGAFDVQNAFHLEIAMLSQICNSVGLLDTPHSISATAGQYKTLVLTDFGRMDDTNAEKATLMARLIDFVERDEVKGVIVNVGDDLQVEAYNTQANTYTGCPYAKNLVATSIKELVDAYAVLNPELAYVVIVGGDGVIPFFRYPDSALLANENNYVPPLRDSTASQAALRLGYVLGQDAYGAQTELLYKNTTLPIPKLAVGRLVESAAEATAQLDAYLATPGGVVTVNTEPLVTGYDFLEDAALAVQYQLEQGTGRNADTLITPNDVAPDDPASWNAAQLDALLLGERHDITFLAGHFSQSGALAADYSSRLTTADVLAAQIDMRNMLIFSAGCHSGYNVVNGDAVSQVTEAPDWAEAFAGRGATLVAGTGYQYGDTDFIEYSERLYVTFSEQLRTTHNSQPQSIGQALNAAKRAYLAETAVMRGIHHKALVQVTIFGLPMLTYDLGGTMLTPDGDGSIVSSSTPFSQNPGAALGLSRADLTVTPLTQLNEVTLTNVSDSSQIVATYLSGVDGVVSNPAELVLPLEQLNVSLTDQVLRGVGFRGGLFTEISGVVPLTGAPTTEIRGVHGPFEVNYFYPIQMWRTNYIETVAEGGATRLSLTPAQFRSDQVGATTGTLRRYSQLDFRLFFSENTAVFNTTSTPALAAPPTIVRTYATESNGMVQFETTVVGNPAAGIQEVWLTITGADGGFEKQWQALDLRQSSSDSSVWHGEIPLGSADPEAIRYFVHAVNGVGLVGMATNLGEGYKIDPPLLDPAPTELMLNINTPGASAAYGESATLSAVLTSGGSPVSGAVVRFGLGLQSRVAVTNASGVASVGMTLLGVPNTYDVTASYAGSVDYAAATDSGTFSVTKQGTVLTLNSPASGFATDAQLVEATLTDANGRRLTEKSVIFVIEGVSGSLSRAAITDYLGRAYLGTLTELPPGMYTVKAYFSGSILLSTGEVLDLSDLRYNSSTDLNGTLTILNSPPIGSPDAYTVEEDGVLDVPAEFGVLANDGDVNGSALSAILLTPPAHGMLTLNDDGSFSYAPDADFYGTDQFTYAPDDGMDSGAETAVTLTVNPVNDAPHARDDAYSVLQDSVLTVAAPGVLGNDEDVENDPLEAAVVDDPSNGMVTLNSDGSFSYTPEIGFYGSDSFTYTASDGEAVSNVATVHVTVIQKNVAPNCSLASSDIETIWPVDKRMVPVRIIGITDADGDTVVVTITSIFQDEKVGNGTNSPDGAGLGTDTALVRAERLGKGNGRVYHVSYEASDGNGGICRGTVRLPTVAHDQSYNIDEIDEGPLYDSTIAD